jgi:hypothetical protein
MKRIVFYSLTRWMREIGYPLSNRCPFMSKIRRSPFGSFI